MRYQEAWRVLLLWVVGGGCRVPGAGIVPLQLIHQQGRRLHTCKSVTSAMSHWMQSPCLLRFFRASESATYRHRFLLWPHGLTCGVVSGYAIIQHFLYCQAFLFITHLFLDAALYHPNGRVCSFVQVLHHLAHVSMLFNLAASGSLAALAGLV